MYVCSWTSYTRVIVIAISALNDHYHCSEGICFYDILEIMKNMNMTFYDNTSIISKSEAGLNLQPHNVVLPYHKGYQLIFKSMYNSK